MNTVEIREARVALIEEEKKIYAAAQAESERAFTGVELERIEKIENDLRDMDKQYMDAREAEAKASVQDRMNEPVQPNGERYIAAAIGNQIPMGSPEGRFFRDMVEGRAIQGTTALSSLVPKPLMSEISLLLDRVSAARQASKVVSVGAPMRIPRLEGYGTAITTGTVEGGTFNTVDPDFGEIDTSTKITKGTGSVIITNEMIHDGQFDIESLCVQTIAEAIGHFQESKFMNGDGGAGGTAEPEGLFSLTGYTPSNVFDTNVNASDMTCALLTEGLLTKLPPQCMGLPRTVILSQAAAAALLSDTDGSSGTGRLLLQQSANSTFANMPSMSILGTQILISSAVTANTTQSGVNAVLMTSDTYHIHDLGGLWVQPDPFTLSVQGMVRVNAYQRSAGMVVRPESLVQFTK